MDTMRKVVEEGTCTEVTQEGDIIHVTVAPPNEVGSFSEEERSRQVSQMLCYSMYYHAFYVHMLTSFSDAHDTSFGNSLHFFALSVP